MIFEFSGPKVLKLKSKDYPRDAVSACISAPEPLEFKAKIIRFNKKEEECLDHVYVGIYTPHSWWGASGMPFAKDIKAGDTIIIEVTGKSSFRIDLDCEEIK